MQDRATQANKWEKVSPEIQRAVGSLAGRIGVSLDPSRVPGVQWDGKSIAVGNQELSSVIHDIAHYAVCPRWRRSKIDFGLGLGPDSTADGVISDDDCCVVARDYAQSEEELASALGIVYEHELGLDPEPTLSLHQWFNVGSRTPSFWTTLTDLVSRGLVSGEAATRFRMLAAKRNWVLPGF